MSLTGIVPAEIFAGRVEKDIHSQKERESQEEGGTVVGEINQELMELWFKSYRRTFNFSVA